MFNISSCIYCDAFGNGNFSRIIFMLELGQDMSEREWKSLSKKSENGTFSSETFEMNVTKSLSSSCWCQVLYNHMWNFYFSGINMRQVTSKDVLLLCCRPTTTELNFVLYAWDALKDKHEKIKGDFFLALRPISFTHQLQWMF